MQGGTLTLVSLPKLPAPQHPQRHTGLPTRASLFTLEAKDGCGQGTDSAAAAGAESLLTAT